jgi:AcrR family transcriptional regulator
MLLQQEDEEVVTAVRSTETPHVALRKRGAALEAAILEAAFAEISEMGYTAFSVESVAARAHTGKASIYRRWPTKQELVMDALLERMPTPEQCGIVLDIDESVTTVDALYGVARAIGAVITSSAGDAMRAIKCEALADPELARLIDDRFQAPRREAMIGLLKRGVARGEVRPGADTVLVADVLPAILTHRVILQREPLTERDLTEIMEQVFIPLIEVR